LGALLFVFAYGNGWAWSPGTSDPTAVDDFSVDTTSRMDVLSFYNTIYPASEDFATDLDWTGGSVVGDTPGTISSTFKSDVQRRVNFYRALVGVSTNITFDTSVGGESQYDQLAALMMSANNMLSHSPPDTWVDYTANGAMAAGNSNLALGVYGPAAVDGYMVDPGSNNIILGHRRWLIFTQSQIMGTGDVPATGTGIYNGTSNFAPANAIWVIQSSLPTVTPQYNAWPNAGYSPITLMPSEWSLSYTGQYTQASNPGALNLGADFSNATVTMTQGTNNIPVTINTGTTGSVGTTAYGYGDNTIGWTPVTPLPTTISGDTTYNITVSNILLPGSSTPTSYSYSVTLFDPNVLGNSVSITGSTTPPVTGATYNFNSISEADSYELLVSTATAAPWLEGAEDSPPPQIIDDTTGTYPLRQTAVVYADAKAFQLAFPQNDFTNQSFEITRDIVPSANSDLQFYDEAGYTTSTTTLSAEISIDEGSTWTTVWSRNGVGSNPESAFTSNSVSLAAYAGQEVLVQFVMSSNDESEYQLDGNSADNHYFGFFIDNITVTNATQLINTTSTTLAGSATSFTLNAATAGSGLTVGTTYYLRIAPTVGTRLYGTGPDYLVTAQAASYSQWVSGAYPQVTGGPAGDYSNDGIANGLKFAFGLNPTVNNPVSSLPAPVISGSNMTISYTQSPNVAGVVYGAQWSTDLHTWNNITDTGSGLSHIFTKSITGLPKVFMRNVITITP
jgi:hypothetical protein